MVLVAYWLSANVSANGDDDHSGGTGQAAAGTAAGALSTITAERNIQNDSGQFHFGYVQGHIECRQTTRDGKPAVEWTWDGNDETGPAQGRGSTQLALKVERFFATKGIECTLSRSNQLNRLLADHGLNFNGLIVDHYLLDYNVIDDRN